MDFVEGASLDFAAAAWVVAWSLVAFLTMAVDKRRSRVPGQRRVRERTLLALCAAGGAPGAWLAMRSVRHKTKHRRFRVLVPFWTVVWLLLVILLVVLART